MHGRTQQRCVERDILGGRGIKPQSKIECLWTHGDHRVRLDIVPSSGGTGASSNIGLLKQRWLAQATLGETPNEQAILYRRVQ